jgi:hypothetical protein
VGDEGARRRLILEWYDRRKGYKKTEKTKAADKLAKSSKTNNQRVFRNNRSVRNCGECGKIEVANWRRHWDNNHP